MQVREIWCCDCGFKVKARLTDGKEIYPHREDLYKLPFWICDRCDNFVGCHWKTKDRTRPLGIIPTPAIKNARKHIHALLDPMWKNRDNAKRKRTFLYNIIKERLGSKYDYHTANIISVEEGRKVYRIILDISKEIESNSGNFFQKMP